VQQTLEEALAVLDPARPMTTFAAGRTDAGVHAAGQVVHFDAAGPIPPSRWPKALNGRLPATIRVRAAAAVPKHWHACFSASYRRYRYTLYNGVTPNLFLAPWSWHRYRVRLDEARMNAVLQELRGEHDFSAFQRAGSRRADAITTLQDLRLERQGDLLVVELQASGFLYGMVRWRRSAGDGSSELAGRSRRPPLPRGYACCGWATPKNFSPEARGTIVNRDFSWDRRIHPWNAECPAPPPRSRPPGPRAGMVHRQGRVVRTGTAQVVGAPSSAPILSAPPYPRSHELSTHPAGMGLPSHRSAGAVQAQ
jgi:tRNA pseudouridine(38-40) synthase